MAEYGFSTEGILSDPEEPMIELPWLQMSGAIAGGLVGSFSGFIANSFHEHRVRRRIRRNIACAVIGEISALSQYIADNYLTTLSASIEAGAERQEHPHHHFRGDRDYMPIFRTIGSTVGYLPTPLPRDLVSWYTTLAAALERARALHELAAQGNPSQVAHTIELARLQQAVLTDLVASSKPLIERLSKL